jgi:hypothetical protein
MSKELKAEKFVFQMPRRPLQKDGKQSCALIFRIHPRLNNQKALLRDIQALKHTPSRPVSDAAMSGPRVMDCVFSLVRYLGVKL